MHNDGYYGNKRLPKMSFQNLSLEVLAALVGYLVLAAWAGRYVFRWVFGP